MSSSDGSRGVKSLGVKIDENLNMRQQIAQVRQSSFYAISNLGRLKNVLSVDVRLMLIKQLILSKVDYHNALYVNLPACDVKRLQSVVNAAVRFVYGAGKRVPARQLLIQAHILPVRYRIQWNKVQDMPDDFQSLEWSCSRISLRPDKDVHSLERQHNRCCSFRWVCTT